ncbi:hypothetical protein ACFVH6_21845 [Spirillospora sp. NPDC127200]
MATEFAAPFAGSPIATAVQFRKRNRPGAPDGVDAAWGSTALQVSSSGGSSVNIANGRALVQGALYELTSGPLNLAVSANGSGTNRTDYAVLTYNDAHTPGVYARVLTGTALTRTDTGTFDFPLATWQKTPAGAITGLTDLRTFIGSEVRACTSTTRPSSPRLGQVCYEVDTGRWIGRTGAAWEVIWEDTGWVSLATTGGTAGPDAAAWTNNAVSRVRRLNGQVHLRIAVRRWANNGLALTDEDGSAPFTLPATFRPGIETFGMGYAPAARQLAVGVAVEPSGTVRLRPLIAALPASYTVQAAMSWPVG